jgi:hypothetical protein
MQKSKGIEKKAAKRENGASMYVFGREASPKDGVVGDADEATARGLD